MSQAHLRQASQPQALPAPVQPLPGTREWCAMAIVLWVGNCPAFTSSVPCWILGLGTLPLPVPITHLHRSYRQPDSYPGQTDTQQDPMKRDLGWTQESWVPPPDSATDLLCHLRQVT